MFLMLIPTFVVTSMMVFNASACTTRHWLVMRSETSFPKLQVTFVKSVSNPSSIVMRMTAMATEPIGERERFVGVARSPVVHGGVGDKDKVRET
jgi:hypothetical protein